MDNQRLLLELTDYKIVKKYIRKILTGVALAMVMATAIGVQTATLTWSNPNALYWQNGKATWGSSPVFGNTADVVMGRVADGKGQCMMISYNGQFSSTIRSITFNALFGSGKTSASESTCMESAARAIVGRTANSVMVIVFILLTDYWRLEFTFGVGRLRAPLKG